MDNKEPSNPDIHRQNNGNNRYIHSNIHQWLNSDKAANNWYTSQHSYDTPPDYQNKAGFLNQWDSLSLSVLDDYEYTVTRISTDGGGTETFIAKICLMSTTEVGLEGSTGGNRLDIFNSNEDRKLDQIYSLRSPGLMNGGLAYCVMTNGTLNAPGGHASVTPGLIRPICVPNEKVYVSNEVDSDGCYTITGVVK